MNIFCISMAITSFYTSDLSLGDRKPKSWIGLIRLKILFNKVLLKKHKQMFQLPQESDIWSQWWILLCKLQPFVRTSLTDRKITVTISCITSEGALKSSLTPREYFCQEIYMCTHSRPSITNDSHCLDTMRIDTSPRHAPGKQTRLIKGTGSSSL